MSRNFYVPPIVFAAKEDGSKNCLDGKQRLISIQRFMDGLIPYHNRFTGEQLWYKTTMITEGSATKQLLPKELRVSFLRKQVVCLEHIGLTSEDERELFNVSLAFPKHSWSLSRGFIRGKFWDLPSNLVSQPARLVHFVRELLDAYVVLDSTLRTMPWDRREGLDFCIFSHTVRYIEMWPSQESLEIKSLEGWLEGNVEIAPEIGSRVRNTLDLFKQISSNLEYNRPLFTYKMIFPIEMIFISLLIFVCGVLPSPELKLSPGDISKQISELRTFIHDEFGECDSLDDRTGTTLFDFIKRRERIKEVSLEQSVTRQEGDDYDQGPNLLGPETLHSAESSCQNSSAAPPEPEWSTWSAQSFSHLLSAPSSSLSQK